MKQVFKYTLWVMFVLIFNIGCTLSSRQTFDLSYQESKLLNTLQKGPYKSLASDGLFDAKNHALWDIDTVNMEISISDVIAGVKQNTTIYSFEMIEDIDVQSGIIRFYGAGSYNDMYAGVSALTNVVGAFLKLSIQDTTNNAVSNASKKPYWEYATDPIIFRANNLYVDKSIVTLDVDGFFDLAQYEFIIPRKVKDQFKFEHYSVVGAITNKLSDIIVNSTRLIPNNIEIYQVTINGVDRYAGMEFYPDKTSTRMKFIIGSSFDDVFNRVNLMKLFGWDLLENARISNKVIRLLSSFQMVFLTKIPGALDIKEGDYYWDKTDELIFDADKMTLNIITTFSILPPYGPFGATNFLSYNLKMIEKQSDTAGIFEIKGVGKYADKWGILNAIPVGNIMYADFEVANSLVEAQRKLTDILTTTNYKYQDQKSARLPYRLIENMDGIGSIWVKLQKDATGSMSYDIANTEHYNFLDLDKRTLRYAFFTKGAMNESFYKVEIVTDNNITNGAFLLKGFTDNSFTTPSTSAPMHNKYIAIDRGSELYKTQAKYAVANTLEEAQRELSKVLLFNLHERSSLPSNYRVISAMEKYGKWIALIYPGSTFPGDVPIGLAPSTAPNFIQDNTYEITFNTSVIPQFTLIAKIAPAADTFPDTYDLETIVEISPTHAIFKLSKTISGNGPDLDGKFMAVRSDVGVSSDKAYIGIGDTQIEAEDNLTKLATFYNYHAKDTAPLNATVIETIKDISFMESALDATTGLAIGSFIPFNTKYYKFSYNPLTLIIDTVEPSGNKPKECYSLITKVDGGDHFGIFQLYGSGLSLDNLFIRIDVQKGVDGQNIIRILSNRNIADLTTGTVTGIVNDTAFSIGEITHKNKNSVMLLDTAVTAITAISSRWVKVDDIDKMYDYKNTRELTVDQALKTIQVVDKKNNTIINNETYNYSIMENIYTSATSFELVVQLSGSGAFRDLYVALTYTLPTTPPFGGVVGAHGVSVGLGPNYSAAKAQLALVDPYIPYNDPWADPNILAAFNSFLPSNSPIPGFGTPSYVWMKNGIYTSSDTEQWTFDPVEKTVRIEHNGGVNRVDYSVHMLQADAVSSGIRYTSLFYLKSVTATGLYHNSYIQIRNHNMINTVGTIDAESTFEAVIDKDRSVVENSVTAVSRVMRDFRSANIPSRAFDLASTKTWVSLDKDAYQLNNAKYEKWEFRYNKEPKVRVTDDTGVSTIYNFVSRDDISSHRGVFILNSPTGSTPGKYNQHIVAIGIGNEKTVPAPSYNPGGDFDVDSMRLSVKPIGSSIVTAQAAAISEMEGFSEWNFREENKAKIHFNPIMEAARIDSTGTGWAKLTYDAGLNSYVYDNANTERWIFNTIIPTSLNNISGSVVYDMLINTGSITPTARYGIRLINASSTGVRAEFQIFRNNILTGASTRSNKFVVLELGRGLNEKLMRVGMGDTLEEAKIEFDNLGQNYNWSSYDRAISGYGVITSAESAGKWSLTRRSASDTSDTGSAITTSGFGHFPDSGGNPVYNPADIIDVSFLTANHALQFDYSTGLSATLAITPVENPSSREGVYILRGFGPFSEKFVYIELKDLPNGIAGVGVKGRLSMANTLTDVKKMNQDLKTANTWNFFSVEYIKVDSIVFNTAASHQKPPASTPIPGTPVSLGAHVELGFEEVGNPNIYDSTLSRSYTIIASPTNINGRLYEAKSLIISNIALDRPDMNTRDDIYTYEMVDSQTTSGQYRAVALLIDGNGPDENKFIAIRLPSDSVTYVSSASIKLASTLADAKTAIDWPTATIDPSSVAGNTAFRYRILKDVVSKSDVITKLRAARELVTLDSDRIYLDNDTTEWNFNPNKFTATVVERMPSGTINTTTYKTVPVKAVGENNIKGVFYLKGSGGILDKKYMAVTDANTPSISIKADFVDTLALAEASLAVTGVIDPNFVEKSSVYLPIAEPVITTLIRAKKWNSLDNGFLEQAQASTTNFKFLENRVVELTIGSTPMVELRYKPIYAEDNVRAIFKLESKGSTDVPLAFRNHSIAINTITSGESQNLRLRSLPNIDINNASSLANIINIRDNILKDPNYIPDDIFSLSRASLQSLNAVSSGSWRMVDSNDELIGSTDDTITAWRNLYATDPATAPWSMSFINDMNILVSRSSKNKISIEGANRKYNYLSRIIASDGPYNSVFRIYRGELITDINDKIVYDTEISNKYYALRVGINQDHFRSKLVSADSISEARSKLNNLEFNNIVAAEIWGNRSSDSISNMNINRWASDTVETQEVANWGQWVSNPSTGFDTQNHEYWTFNHNIGALSITHNTIVNGIVSSATYGLTLMQRLSAISAIYVLNGYGIYNDRILVFERPSNSRDSAFYFITTAANNTYTAAKAGFEAVKRNTANWKEKRELLVTVKSIANMASLGAFVSIDRDTYALSPSVNVLNKRDNTEWTFSIAADLVTASALVTTIVNGIPTAINYNLEMIEDEDNKAVFVMRNATGGSFHNYAITLNILASAATPYIIVQAFDGTTDLTTATASAVAAFNSATVPSPTVDTVYYKKTELEENYKVIEIGDLKNELVTLDQDGIYLPHEALEMIFDSKANTLNVVVKEGPNAGSYNYFLNSVKGVTPGATGAGAQKGMYYLIASKAGAPLDKHFIGIEVQSTANDNAYGKFVTSATGVLTDTDINNNGKRNLVTRNSVDIDDAPLLKLESIEGVNKNGLGLLHSSDNDYTFDPNSTEELHLDVKQRVLLYISKKTGSHETNYYRILLQASETPDPTQGERFSFQMISNTRSDINFRGNPAHSLVASGTAVASGSPVGGSLGGTLAKNNWFWALGIPDNSISIFLGYDRRTIAYAKSNRDTGKDPKILPLDILRNDPKVSKSLNDQLSGGTGATDWYLPVDENREIVTDVSAVNFAFRTPLRTAANTGVGTASVAVYDFDMTLRDAANPKNATGTKAAYLTKVMADFGSYDGVVQAHGINESVFKAIISNKYVAIKYGIGSDETKVKLAIADTESEAMVQLNSLQYWNYVPKFVLDATPRVIQNLSTKGTWVFKTGNNATVPTYNAANTKDYEFARDGSFMTIHNVVASVTNSVTYGIQMIEDTSEFFGLFQLVGFGSDNGKFMIIDNTVALDANNAKAKYALGDTIARTKAKLNTVLHPNLYRKQSIVSIGQVFPALAGRDIIVERTYNEPGLIFYYDSKSVYEYKFSYNSIGGAQVSITTITKSRNETHNYEMFILEDTSITEGYFTLTATGNPEHNKIIGIKADSEVELKSGQFKIQVEGRDRIKLSSHVNNAQLIGNIANQKSWWTHIVNSNHDKSTVFKEKDVVLKLQSLGAIGTFSVGTTRDTPSGVFDPNNNIVYNFNGNGLTLQTIVAINGVKSYFNYDLSVVEDVSTGGIIDNKKGVLIAQGSDTLSESSFLHDQFIDIDMIDDDRFIITYNTTLTTVKARTTALKNRATTFPYSYWTHEKLPNIDMQNRVVDTMRELSLEFRDVIEVTDWDITKPLKITSRNGLVLLSDKRFFKNDGIGTSRVQGEGYYDLKDYYYFKVNPDTSTKISSWLVKQSITNSDGSTIVITDMDQRIKTLEYESPTKGTFLLLKGVSASGGAELSGNAEMRELFENAVLSVNVDKDQQMIIGYAKPASASRADIETAMVAAKADRDARLSDIRQYTPNLVGEYIARQQHFVPYILSGNAFRTFVGADGVEAITPGTDVTNFNFNGKQLSVNFLAGNNNQYGGTNNFHTTVKLKLNSQLNIEGTAESSGTDDTKLLLQSLRVDGKETMIFKFHRPDTITTALVTDSFWSNLVFNKYHAIKIGTGANLFQHKWAYSDSIVKAQSIVASLPFYNGSYSWISSAKKREYINRFLLPTGNFYQIKKVATAHQNFTSFTSSGTAFLELVPFKSGNRYFITVKEFTGANTMIPNPFTYEMVLKDASDTSGKIAFGVEGFGPMNGLFIFFNTGDSNNSKMMLLKPGYGQQFNNAVNQFLHDSGSTGEFLFRDKSRNVRKLTGSQSGTPPSY